MGQNTVYNNSGGKTLQENQLRCKNFSTISNVIWAECETQSEVHITLRTVPSWPVTVPELCPNRLKWTSYGSLRLTVSGPQTSRRHVTTDVKTVTRTYNRLSNLSHVESARSRQCQRRCLTITVAQWQHLNATCVRLHIRIALLLPTVFSRFQCHWRLVGLSTREEVKFIFFWHLHFVYKIRIWIHFLAKALAVH